MGPLHLKLVLTHGNMTIYSYLEMQSTKYKEKPFLQFEDQVISYEEMFRKANQTATWLEKEGIIKGDIVTVMIKNCPSFYDIWFACAALGAVLLPVNTASTASELKYFLEHSESKGIIFDRDLITNNHEKVMLECNLLFTQALSNDWLKDVNNKSDEKHEKEVQASDVAGIMYTSGTTAKPKGVLITHENYLYAGHSSVLYQQLTPEDKYLIFLPLFHANSQ